MQADKNITAIFLTNNKLPAGWVKFHTETLLKELADRPLITISRKPMELGINLIQEEPSSPSNVYWQLLRGCKIAKTDYIAVVEDDSLYPAEHFSFRPLKHGIGYNMCKWSLFTWEEDPVYSWRNRRGNYTMVGNRQLVIECLEERFAKYPQGTPADRTGEIGRPMVEHNLGLKERKVEEFMTTLAIINLNHDMAMDRLQLAHRKRHGLLRAYDIPYWGKAKDIINKFK